MTKIFAWTWVDRWVATVESVVAPSHQDTCDGGVLFARRFVFITLDTAVIIVLIVRIIDVVLDAGLQSHARDSVRKKEPAKRGEVAGAGNYCAFN